MRPNQRKKLDSPHARRLRLEPLEERALLAISVSGIPGIDPNGAIHAGYAQQGPGGFGVGGVIPGPITGGEADVSDNIDAGAVQAIAVDPNKGDRAFVGSVNGGIWRTDNLRVFDTSQGRSGKVPWDPMTDQLPSLSIGSLAFLPNGPVDPPSSPTPGDSQVLYAGIADTSHFHGFGGALTGVLLTLDGGGTWQQLGTQPPAAAPIVSPGVNANLPPLQPGTYFLKFTYVNGIGPIVNGIGPNATESTPSLESAPFTVAPLAGGIMKTTNVPVVNLPALPKGAIAINVYLTPPGGPPGSEVYYATYGAGGNLNLAFPFNPLSSRPPPIVNALTGPGGRLGPDPAAGGLAGLNVFKIVPTDITSGPNIAGNAAANHWVLAATSSGVFLSHDGGQTWVSESSGAPNKLPLNVSASDLELDDIAAGNDEVLYAAIPGQGIYRAVLAPVAQVSNGTFPVPLGLQWTLADGSQTPQTNTTVAPIANPAAAPPVNRLFGGLTFGQLAAGTYYLEYTWTDSFGGETQVSPEAQFTITAAENSIPQMILPSLPVGASGANVYLTPTNGGTGSELLYKKGVTGTTFNLSKPQAPNPSVSGWPGPGDNPPSYVFANAEPAPPSTNNTFPPVGNPGAIIGLSPTGGVGTGTLAAGSYFVEYTWTNAFGETQASSEAGPIKVVAGNVPEFSVPNLPAGATGINIYLTPPNGAAGSEVLYDTAPPITPGALFSTVFLTHAAPTPAPTPVYSQISKTSNIKLAILDDPAKGIDVVFAALTQPTNAQFGNQCTGVFESSDQGNTWQSWGVPGDGDGPVDPVGENDVTITAVESTSNQPLLIIAGDAKQTSGDVDGNLFVSSGPIIRPGPPPTIVPAGWISLVGHSRLINSDTVIGAPHADSRTLLFANGYLYLGCDGGIYALSHPTLDGSGQPYWYSANGNLAITEFVSVAYDSVNNVLLGGAQDVSVVDQAKIADRQWETTQTTGDGGSVAVKRVGNDTFWYYTGGGPVFAEIKATANITTGSNNAVEKGIFPRAMAVNGVASTAFGTFAVDAVGSAQRIVMASKGNLLESTDAGSTATLLGQFAGTPALAYGGTLNGQANPDLLYVGAGPNLFLRTTSPMAGGQLTVVRGYRAAGGGSIQGIAINPDDWRQAWIVDANGQVWTTANVLSNQLWTNVTLLLGELVNDPQSITVVPTKDGSTPPKTVDVVMVAGGTAQGQLVPGTATGGVYQLLDPANNIPNSNVTTKEWVKFGAFLPNAVITTLHYDQNNGDDLVIGTMGRGAYLVPNASTLVGQAGVLTVNGDDDPTNLNDNIDLTLDPNNPLLLDVSLDSEPTVQVPIAAISQILVNGGHGSDTLTVDFSNGVFTPPDGFVYDGGGGGDIMRVINIQGGVNVDTPSSGNHGNGVDTSGGSFVVYKNLAPVFVDGGDQFTLITPNSGNSLVLDTPAAGSPGAGGLRISGSSGGVAFENATVSTTAHVVLDLATNDGPTENDTVMATATAMLAVPNTDVTLNTGPNVAGNVLDFDAQGNDVVLTQNSIQVVGAQPLTFDTLGTINLTNPGNITVEGASSADSLVVGGGPLAGGLRLNNGPLVVFNTLLSLHFVGNGGGDSLTIHNPIGRLFAPSGGIQFDGGDQSGMLTLDGGGGSVYTETYNTGPAAFAGNLAFAGQDAIDSPSVTITLTGVAHISDNVTVGLFTVNGPEAANTITLDDGPLSSAGMARITVDQCPVIEFDDKARLIINGSGGASQRTSFGDTIYVNYAATPTELTAVTVNGGNGDDVIRVFASPLVPTEINGRGGNDLVAVKSDLAVPFTILGGTGDDTIYGGAGDDTIDAGTGNNVVRAQGGDATIYSSGNDLIYTGDGNVTVNGGPGSETVYGGKGNDTIDGDQGFNLIHAGDGRKTVVNGGPSGNLIFAGAGDDELHGGAGNDTIYGGPGADTIFGAGGDDLLVAGSGRTEVFGGAGKSLIFGGPGASLLDGGAGNDTIVAGNGPETIRAGDGDTYVVGGPRTLSVTLGNGNNVVIGGSGPGEVINTGTGNTVIVGSAGGDDTISAQGPARIWGRGGHNTITGGFGDDVIDTGAGGGNTVTGGSGADILIGRDSSDSLPGNSASFVYANSAVSNPLPSYAVPAPPVPPNATLSTGIDERGRWTDLAGSATGAGLSGLPGFSVEPSIVAAADGEYVAWADQRSGDFAIYLARHTASGWQELAGSAHGGGISGGPGDARQPSIALDSSGNPIVAWTQFTGGKSDIEAARYDPTANGGQGGWVALGDSLNAGGISADGAAQGAILVNTAAGPVVAWLDSTSGAANVFVAQFNGNSWLPLGAGAAGGTGVSGDPGGVSDLALATDGTKVAVAWTELVTQSVFIATAREVYLKEFSGGGWHELAGSASGNGISDTTADSRAPTLAYQAGSLFAAWQDDSSNYWEINAAEYDGGAAWVRLGNPGGGISDTRGSATQPKLASAGGQLYLLWADDRIQNLTGNTIALYAKKWNGVEFVEELPGDASGQGISETGGDPQGLALSVDSSGHPFVAWSENAGSGNADDGPRIFVRGNTFDVGTVYYVNDGSTAGDEVTTAPGAAANNGLSPGSPLPSIQSVLNAYSLGAGDVIVVDTGEYTDGLSVPAASSGFLVLGAPGRVADIQGLADLSNSTGVTLEGLNLAGGVTATDSTNATLSDDTIAGVTLDGGSAAQLVYDRIFAEFKGGNVTALTLEGGASAADIENNAISGGTGVIVAGSGATGLVLRDNQILGGAAGIVLSVAADGQIAGNQVSATTTGLEIDNAFSGLIENDEFSGAQVGVAYNAAAALSGNLIHDNKIGVTSTVLDVAAGFGFVGATLPNATLPNQIYANTVGALLLNAAMQNQHVYGNVTGVSGTGSLVSADLDHANRIENNTTGVDFAGPIEFNRIAGNVVGIQAHSGQLIAQNVIDRNTQTALSVDSQTGVQIVQNTFYTPSGDLVRIQAGSSNVEVRNNIFWTGAGYDLFIANDSQSGFTSDYNDLHASGTGKIVFWEQDFTDVLDWQQDVAQFDLHSIGTTVVNPNWSQPRFYSAALDDYRVFGLTAGLRLSSPTIDAGDPTLALDQGAFGNSTTDTNNGTHIALRFPDLYTDWEANVSHTILWNTYNNTSQSQVKIDLYQDGPSGPQFLLNITPGTLDTGTFNFIPSFLGIGYGTKGLRIQISLVGDPGVFDRSTETFAVPENTDTFFVNGATVNPGGLTTAAGSNRNTGKLPSEPKPFPNNVLRIYTLGPNQTLSIDQGGYPLLEPLVISDTSAVGDDQGFTLTGPANAAAPAVLSLANPLTHAPIVEVTGSNSTAIDDLTMTGGSLGLLVDGGSTNFTGSFLTVRHNLQDGLRVEQNSTAAALDHVTAFDNLANGITISGAIASLSDSTVHDNLANGIDVTDAGSAAIEANQIYANGGSGLIVSNSVAGTTTVVGNTDLTQGRGNQVHDNLQSGISATGNVLVVGNTVSGQSNPKQAGIALAGAEVSDNIVRDNYDGIVGKGTISFNRVYHNADAGIIVGNGVVQGNVVYSNAYGIQGYGGGNQLTNDLVYANTILGVGFHGAGGNSLINATVYQPQGDAVDIDGGAVNVQIRNDILWTEASTGAGYDISVANDSQQGFASDYNDLFTSGAGQVGLWQSAARASFAAWQKASHGDQSSLSQDPLFVDPAGPDGFVGYANAIDDGSDDDFHEQSVIGSFHGGSLAPVLNPATGLPVVPTATLTADANQSPAIDRGDGADSFANEPQPNGGYVNQGAFGDTAQASETHYHVLIAPVGGYVWTQGQTFTIRWRLPDPSRNVDINLYELDDQGGKTFVQTIADVVDNNGAYAWTIPTTLAPGSKYIVDVIGGEGNDASGSVPFSILALVHTYYVNDGTVNPGDWTTAPGNDANDGLTPATPKASIAAVLQAYQPGNGDTIMVDEGTYNLNDNIRLPAADSGVTIVGYNDPNNPDLHATIDRGSQSAGSYGFELTGANDVTLDHLFVTDAQTGIIANDTGSQELMVSNSEIYGNAGYGIDLSGPSIEAATISGNRVHDNGGTGIAVGGGAGMTVTSNTVYDNAGDGIDLNPGQVSGYSASANTVYGNQNGIVVSGPSGTSSVVGTVVSDNISHDNAVSGIVVAPNALAQGNTVYGQSHGPGSQGLLVSRDGEARGNSVFLNYDGIVANGLVDFNTVYQNADAGIVANVRGRVLGNQVYSNTYGIQADGDNATSGTSLANNLVYSNSSYGIGIHGGSGTPLTNNTVYQPTGDAVVVDGASNNIQINSNILWAVTGHDLVVATDSRFMTDYNDLVVANGNLLGNWDNRDFSDLAAWSLSTHSFDLHSITADPQFINVAGGEFHVQSTSPTIDAGDPTADYSNEPAPNGGRVNQGFDGNTSAATPSPLQSERFVFPAGLEKFVLGQTLPITWLSVGAFSSAGANRTVSIDLVRDGDPNFDQPIAISIPDNGSFSWTIPASLPLAGDYRIRVQSDDSTMPAAVTNATFLITNAGHDFYVNDGSTTGDVFTTAVGNDANSGKSPDQPVASLQALLAAYTFGPGDVIHVDTGTYNLLGNIRLTSADSGVTIVGPSTGAGALFDRGDTTSGAYVFELAGATGVTLDHLGVTDANVGVEANDSGSTNLTVSNSAVFANAADGIQLFGNSVSGAQITANRAYDNGGSGIDVSGGGNHTITGNQVYDNRAEGISADVGPGAAPDSVSGNTAYGNGDGIVADGAGAPVSISANVSHDNVNAGIIAKENVSVGGNQVFSNGQGIQAYNTSGGANLGPYLFDNLVYANTTLGVGLHGGANAQFVSNTVYQPTGNALVIDGPSINVQLKNNILWAQAGYDIMVSADNAESNLESDYNDLYTSGAGILGHWEDADFTSLDDWVYKLGLDQHSIAADPQFADPNGAHDFHVASTSPTVDAGDPASPFIGEPTPNGGFINLGNYGDTPDATPSPASSVRVLSPGAREKFVVGQTLPISWRTEGAAATGLETVDIDLVQNGAVVLNIATNLPDTFSFAWTVPSQIVGGGYQVRVEIEGAGQPLGLSQGTFLVANAGHDYYINDASTAGDVFTTAAGNDANSGKTPGDPMADLGAMLSAYTFQPGDVIHVDTGDYRLYRNIVVGPQDSGVTIQGPATSVALLDRHNPSQGTTVFTVAGATDVTLDHLSIEGAFDGILAPAGANSLRLTVSNDDISLNQDAGVLIAASNDGARVSGNRVFDNALDGLHLSGNVQALDNHVYGNAVGIAADGGFSGLIEGNVVYANGNQALLLSANNGSQITNNDLYQPTGDAVDVEGGSQNVRLFNNIVWALGGYDLNVAADSQAGFTSNYNLFDTGPSANAQVGFWGGSTQSSLSDWQAASSQDANGLFADPSFVNPAGADGVLGFSAANGYDGGRDDNFYLNQSSPAIDRGNSSLASAPADDDIGAYEFQAPGPLTTPPSVTGTTPAQVDTQGDTGDRIGQLQIAFNEPLNPIDANAPAAYELRKAGANGFGSPDDVVYPLIPQYAPGSTTETLAIGGLAGATLPLGNYRLTIFSGATASLHDLAGNLLDGNADGVPGGDYVRTFTVVSPQADLNLTVAVDNPTPIENGPVRITITLDDLAGPQAANAVQVTDLLPAGLTFASAAPAPGTTYDSSTGAWSIASLAKGGSVTLVINATVNAQTLGQTITDTAVIASTGQTDPNLANNTASATITIAPSADLVVSQTLDDPEPIEGQVIHYTVTLANPAGPEASTGASVQVQLPAGVSFVGATPDAGTSYDSSTGVWSVPGLAVGGSAKVVIAVSVNSGTAGQTLVSTAAIASTAQANLNASNDTSTLNTVVQPGAHLVVTQTVDNPAPVAGDKIQYTITVNNLGPDDAGNVTIRDFLPDGLQIVEYTSTDGSFSTTQGEFSTTVAPQWYLLDLPVGATATLTFTATVDADQGGQTLVNTATLTDLGASDKNLSDGTASASIAVQSPPTLSAIGTNVTATEGATFSEPVATFTISDPQASASDFTATIDWGDGTTAAPDLTQGTVLAQPGGGFAVTGTHIYSAASSGIPVLVAIADTRDGATASAQSTAVVVQSPSTLSATGANVTATQGAAFSATVATFTDTDPQAAAGDFTATINWGDGTTAAPDLTQGTVLAQAGGGFAVTGSHIYSAASSGIPFTVAIADTKAGTTATAQGNAVVVQAPSTLSATGTNVTATEGAAFNATVATFSDSNSQAVAADFTATIDWGDQTSATFGVVMFSDGVFTITGTHTFAEDGARSITMVVHDSAGGSATITDSASASEAVTLGSGGTISASADETISTAVATFTHGDGSEPTSDFTASIDWGDGKTSVGTLSQSNGMYTVTGSHVYAASGTFTIQTTVGEDGIATVFIGGAVIVAPGTPHQRYVEAVYQDVLDRAPDSGGMSFWAQTLDNGAAVSSVADAIAHSDEYYQNFVIRPAYSNLLRRVADAGGVTFWTTQMDAGVTDQELEADLVSSPEFFSNAGGTNTLWIDAVYKLLLGRAPDAGGENYWNSQLAAGQTLNQVAQGIAGSQENNTQLINDDYFHYLGRGADSDGLAYWLGQFTDGSTNEDVIAGFTGSPEYYNKHTS